MNSWPGLKFSILIRSISSTRVRGGGICPKLPILDPPLYLVPKSSYELSHTCTWIDNKTPFCRSGHNIIVIVDISTYVSGDCTHVQSSLKDKL